MYKSLGFLILVLFVFLVASLTSGFKHSPSFSQEVVIDSMTVGVYNSLTDTVKVWLSDDSRELSLSYYSFLKIEEEGERGVYYFEANGNLQRNGYKLSFLYSLDSTIYDTVCYQIKENCE